MKNSPLADNVLILRMQLTYKVIFMGFSKRCLKFNEYAIIFILLTKRKVSLIQNF